MHKTYLRMAVLGLLASLLMTINAGAQLPLQIGSANTAIADPPESRPNTTPCVVHLFSNVGPLTGDPNPFTFTPPANCPGPWAKVILTADFSVNAGRQQERTTSIWVGATNLLYGSAMEPQADLGRSWHVERDVTDYSALFTKPQPGQVTILTEVNASFPSIISGSGSLLFFPTSRSAPARETADVVLPISIDPVLGGQKFVFDPDTISATYTLPKNIERAFVDMIIRNATDDEFYYLCVPDKAIADQLLTCARTPFREAQIIIDGQLAGVALAVPRATEGSIDPLLWRPIPSIGAINFKPVRVDITPFAALLSDGHPHQVAVRVINGRPFSMNGAVLLFLDHGSSQVTGGLELNTLAAPTPVSTQNISTNNGTTSGTFTVKSAHDFKIRGFVNTSHGRVDTEVSGNATFQNQQSFTITGPSFTQNADQTVSLRALTTTRGSRRHGDDEEKTSLFQLEFPISVRLSFISNPDGTFTQIASVVQHRNQSTVSAPSRDGEPAFNLIDTSVTANDTVLFSPSFDIVSNHGMSSSQSYLSRSSGGDCFSRTIKAANGILTSVQDGKGCGHDHDRDDN